MTDDKLAAWNKRWPGQLPYLPLRARPGVVNLQIVPDPQHLTAEQQRPEPVARVLVAVDMSAEGTALMVHIIADTDGPGCEHRVMRGPNAAEYAQALHDAGPGLFSKAERGLLRRALVLLSSGMHASGNVRQALHGTPDPQHDLDLHTVGELLTRFPAEEP